MKTKFETTYRSSNHFIMTIRAETKSDWKMTAYLDPNTGKVLYPVMIEHPKSVIVITLDSDDMSSCSLPPSVPEDQINELVEYIQMMHDVVTAARELIRDEQQRIKEEA